MLQLCTVRVLIFTRILEGLRIVQFATRMGCTVSFSEMLYCKQQPEQFGGSRYNTISGEDLWTTEKVRTGSSCAAWDACNSKLTEPATPENRSWAES